MARPEGCADEPCASPCRWCDVDGARTVPDLAGGQRIRASRLVRLPGSGGASRRLTASDGQDPIDRLSDKQQDFAHVGGLFPQCLVGPRWSRLEEAFEWYEAQRPGLGAAFRRASISAWQPSRITRRLTPSFTAALAASSCPDFRTDCTTRSRAEHRAGRLYARQASPEDVALSIGIGPSRFDEANLQPQVQPQPSRGPSRRSLDQGLSD